MKYIVTTMISIEKDMKSKIFKEIKKYPIKFFLLLDPLNFIMIKKFLDLNVLETRVAEKEEEFNRMSLLSVQLTVFNQFYLKTELEILQLDKNRIILENSHRELCIKKSNDENFKSDLVLIKSKLDMLLLTLILVENYWKLVEIMF
ncbi:hypothetical protein ACTFIZ_000184 [Dictyostelium cf. discoideum]